MLDDGPGGDGGGGGGGDAAEEEVGDVALEDDDLAIAGEDAGEHADGSLENCDDGEHGGDAECDACDADQGSDSMAKKIDQDQFYKYQLDAPTVSVQALCVRMMSSLPRSARIASRKRRFGWSVTSLRTIVSPMAMNRCNRCTAPSTPSISAMLGLPREWSRELVLPLSVEF